MISRDGRIADQPDGAPHFTRLRVIRSTAAWSLRELCQEFGQRIDMMAAMRYPHISKLNLDLLVHLAVLLEERHVTRAANRCFLSQSAMSRQLDRLREALGDELLLRNGRSHERTARGEHLLQELEPLLPRIEGILQGRSFDPEKSQEQFQVTMTDYACMVLLPELAKMHRRIQGLSQGATCRRW